ncbi:MAG: hypothetical protein AAF533_13175 [Acidobacteriota bacterium]
MIDKHKQRAALIALHSIIVSARNDAYQGAPHAGLANLLDKTEYLLILMLEEDDNTDRFLRALTALCEKHRCMVALRKYESEAESEPDT